MKQGIINPVSHHFALSLPLSQSFSQIVLLLSGTFFLNLFVDLREHHIPPLNLTRPYPQIAKYSCFSLTIPTFKTQLRWACTELFLCFLPFSLIY